MAQDSNRPPDPDDLQFDHAEYDTATAPGDPASPAAATCAVCHEPITDAYHTVNQKVVCPRCLAQLQAGLAGGSKTGRVLAATAWGVGAGFLGALLWFAVRRTTGYEVGLIAIVVGLMVGAAVRRGAQGRGGLVYQLLAVFLTYSSIAANYMPDLVMMALSDNAKERSAVVTTQPATTQQATSQAADPATQPAVATAPQSDDGDNAFKDVGPLKAALLLVLLLILVFALAFVAPILAGFENIIGLLIIAFALWEAWKLNKRPQLNIAGPFAVGTYDYPAPSAPPPPPPGKTPQ